MRSLTFLAALLATTGWSVAAAQTGADNCTTPDPIAGQGIIPFDNSLATTGLEGQAETNCYAFGTSGIDNDVWFAWTADATGLSVIQTCNVASFDTKLAAYPGSTCPTTGSSIDCNDDTCGLQSQLSFGVTAGTTYTIQVGNFPGGTGGTAALDIAIYPPLVNDGCTTPSAIAGQGSFPFNLINATTGAEGQTEGLCYAFNSTVIDSDVWYSWTADATGVAVMNTCTSTVDTKTAAYPGVGCPTSGSALACNDDSCGNQSEMSWAVTNGTTYMLQLGTFPGATTGTGNFDIQIFPPATNDNCANPTIIAGQGSFAFNLLGATMGAEGQNELLCGATGTSAINNDVWYAWTPATTGTAVVSTCNSSVDTKMAAYPGSSCPTTGSALACDDNGCGNQSQIQFQVTANSTYMIQLGNSTTGAAGTGNFDITIFPPLTADNCSNPDVIAGQGSFPYDSTLATTGTEGQSETLCYAFGSSGIDNDIWFAWTANATGPATVSTCNGASFDTKLAAYPGNSCPTAGSALACNDDNCSLQSEIFFPVVQGSTYMIQVGNFPGATGGIASFDISIVGPAEPGTAYCFCDSGNSPCGNPGTAGNGCANSVNTNGANLIGSGVASVASDSLVLSGSGLAPSQPGLYFQGNNAINGGAGVIFGDGVRCAGNTVIRLGVTGADAAGNSDTSGFAQSISVKGGVTTGDLRHYQLWYRDPVGSPCGAFFNLTNGYTIQW